MKGFIENLIPSLILSLIGLLFFKFIWLKGEEYYIPKETQNPSRESDPGESSHQDGISSSNFSYIGYYTSQFFDYTISLIKVIKTDDKDFLIEKYGFEYYFYLRFLSKMALISFLLFTISTLVTLGFDILKKEDIVSSLKRIIGYKRAETKNYYTNDFLTFNTILLSVMVVIFIYNAQHLIQELRQQIKIRFALSRSYESRYNLIFRTALVNVKVPGNLTPDDLLDYFLGMNIRGVPRNKICGLVGCSETYKLGEAMEDIEIAKVYCEHHPLSSLYGFFLFW